MEELTWWQKLIRFIAGVVLSAVCLVIACIILLLAGGLNQAFKKNGDAIEKILNGYNHGYEDKPQIIHLAPGQHALDYTIENDTVVAVMTRPAAANEPCDTIRIKARRIIFYENDPPSYDYPVKAIIIEQK